MKIVYVALICAGVMLPVLARAEDEGVASSDARQPVTFARPTSRAHPMPRARDPAAAFAKRLDLDPKQQAQVRGLLEIRQAQVRRVWTDPAIAGGDRVGAVKAINEKTVAQIRALLTEEQRKKYFQPRPIGSRATEPTLSVADWLKATTPKNPDSSAGPAEVGASEPRAGESMP
jgi:hypothetical protein